MSQQQEDLSVNLAIRVAPSMLDRLRERASVEDRPVGWIVRKYVDKGLAADEDGVVLSTEKDQ